MYRFLFCLILPIVYLSEQACAESRHSDYAPGHTAQVGFYNKDSVKNVFDDQLEDIEQPEFSYFPPQNDSAEESPTIDSANATEEDKDAQTLEFVKKYGDPNKNAPIVAIETSPKPFIGLMAALEAGREDLASLYARQYVRHLKNLRKRSDKVQALTKVAIEEEKVAEQEELLMAATKDTNKNLPEEDIKTLSPEAMQLIEQASLDEEDDDTQAFGMKSASVSEVPLDVKARAQIRVGLQGKIPVDPAGKVDVYFFFDPVDPNASRTAQSLEKLYRAHFGNPNINVVGMSVGKNGSDTTDSFRKLTRISFPTRDGNRLSQVFKLPTYPSIAFVSQSTGQMHVESGTPNFLLMDEIVKLMEGK